MQQIRGCLFVLIFLTCTFASQSQVLAKGDSQTRIPEINSFSPDFYLSDMRYWKKKTATLSDFKGKWLLIYAWSLGCPGCVTSFGKLNSLQAEVKDKASIILVGQKHPFMSDWYERYRKSRKLTLPIAYDSAFFPLFNILTVPHLLIIDPYGKIKAITVGSELSKENLEKVFNGEENVFPEKNDIKDKRAYDMQKPFMLNGNGADDTAYLYRSVLGRWQYGQATFGADFSKMFNWSNYNKNGIQLLGRPATQLFQIAYLGKIHYNYDDSGYYARYWREPILEMRDTGVFAWHYPEKNIFNYSLLVPDSMATDSTVQRLMRKDLNAYFGTSAKFEERDMPVWRAVKTRDLSHLNTKGGPPQPYDGFQGSAKLAMKNVPILYLFYPIAAYNANEPPIIDETGVKTNIDIELDTTVDDIHEINKALNKHGINLVKSTQRMKVLVIRDAD